MRPEQARQLVIDLYRGKRRRNGERAWKHPVRVGDALLHRAYREEVVIAGYLHDVLEDGVATFRELRSLGVQEQSVRLIFRLSRRKSQPYWFYIVLTLFSRETAIVKYFDMVDNGRDGFAKWKRKYIYYPVSLVLLKTRILFS